MKFLALLLAFFYFFLSKTQAQPQSYQSVKDELDLSYNAKKAVGPIVIDGMLNEQTWQKAQIASHFIQNFPNDTLLASAQTEIMVSYDDKYFYVAAKAYNKVKNQPYVAPSLKRDYRGEAYDAVVISIDPFMDRTNSFSFGINPFGVQREGLVVNGGAQSEDLSLSWDNKWLSESKIYDDYWIMEMAIPLNTIRFKNGSKQWLINFYRVDSYTGQRSGWGRIPSQYAMISLAFSKMLVFETPIEKKGPNISFIPFTSGGIVNSPITKNGVTTFNHKSKLSFGGDAKIGIGTSFNVDLTVNPDFSQVEVDNQVTNLDRFEILFPEKRQFFLENADLFANFGADGIRPFFSRRIGVTRDPTTGQNVQNQIDGGLRLSGKINNNLRLGFLQMRSAAIDSIHQPANSFSVLTLQQKVFSRSSIGIILTNKQGLGDNHNNRVAGIDYNIASKSNVWNGKLFYQKSFDQIAAQKDQAYGANLIYNSRFLESRHRFAVVESNFNPEMGYLRRKGYQRLSGTTFLSKYPIKSFINRHGPGVDYEVIAVPGKGLTDFNASIGYSIIFKNNMLLEWWLRKDYTKLTYDFDPTNTNGAKLLNNSSYTYYSFLGRFTSDFRKKLAAKLLSQSGQYFNGLRLNLDGEVTYRIQPYGSISSVFSINHLQFPSPYKSADLILVGPKIDITFTKALFFSTLVQYNSQINNININVRSQWRFAPASDLFLVYTNNYYADSYQSKGSALVLKATYWFNL
jgi:hypothetical protein